MLRNICGHRQHQNLMLLNMSIPDFDPTITPEDWPRLWQKLCKDKITSKKIRPNIPIILCTGFSTKLNTDKMKSFGVSKVLIKPVTLSDLTVSVRIALDEAKISN